MKKVIIISLLILFTLLCGLALVIYFSQTKPLVPQKVMNQQQFPIYLPGWLPSDYQIDQDSFAIQEGKIFLFSATDSKRNKLYFSQQPIPKNFDFDRFYQTQIISPIKIEDVVYDAYYGKAISGNRMMLSITTNSSWMIMVTSAQIDTVMAKKITQELYQYK